MMKIKYILICLLANVSVANAQYQNYDIKTPDSDSKTYIGRDYVRLLPGYDFAATASTSTVPAKKMNAKVSSTLPQSDVNTFLNSSTTAESDAVTTIDKTKAVGQIPISSSVSPSGAKCYNVPIEIVPGRQGFQPNISLSYNSQAGNGLVGMGWNISGLSSIERVNKNVFFDGGNEATTISNDGAFALDGVRLIETSRTTEQINYETVQGNTKITAYFAQIGLTGSKFISYFEVLYPNGSVGIFGSQNSRDYAKLSFPISKLTDLNSNEISFSYTSDGIDLDNSPISLPSPKNVAYYIDEINYGKCYDKADFAKVKFTYETRPDQIFSLQSSKTCVYRQVLSKIESFANPNLIRTYSLSYSNVDPRITSNQNDVSRLTQISSFVNTGSAATDNLNPLKFYYGESGTLSTSIQPTSFEDSNFDLTKVNTVRGKFDSNSQNDALIIYPKNDIYKTGTLQSTFLLAYPTGQELKIYQNLNNPTSTPNKIQLESGFLTLFTANVDGIGNDEVVKVNSSGVLSQFVETITFKVYKPDASSGLTLKSEFKKNYNAGMLLDNNNNPFGSVIPREFYAGNFSGKGKTEVLVIPKRNVFTYSVDIFSLDGALSPIFSGNLFIRSDNDLVSPMDIDGDGQTELLHVTNTQTDLYKYKEGSGLVKIGQWALTTADFMSKISTGNFTNSSTQTVTGTMTNTAENQVFFADLNGDGKIDIIKAPERVKKHYKYTKVNVKALKCRKCGALYGNFVECQNGCLRCGDREFVNSFNSYCIYNGQEHWHYNADAGFYDSVIPTPIDMNDYRKDKSGHKEYGTCPVHGCWVDVEYDWNYETHDDWTCYFTDGVNTPVRKTFTGPTCYWNSKIYIQDTDGDNVPELIVDGNLYAYRDKDHVFDASSFVSTGISNSSEIIPFDINSDKEYNQLVALSSTGIQKVSFSQNRAKNNQISLMVNSLGIAEKTNYNQLYQGASYTPDTAALFPNTDFQGPLWVTTQNSAMNNKQLISNTTYAYAGAILHKQGLGLRGFSAMTATDLMTNKTAITEFDLYKMGAVKHQTSDNAESTFTYSFTDYDRTNTTFQKMSLLLNTKTVTDKVKGNTATTTYSGYDTYGNLGKEATDFGGGLKSTIDYTYNNIVTSGLNLIGMPKGRTVTSERNSKTAVQSEGFEYYSTDNRLHYHNKYIGTKLVSQTEYKYNTDYGTVSDEIVHNIPTNDYLTTSYTYWDDDKCSLKAKTNPMGLATNYFYNFTYRFLTDVTDYLGNKVTYGYNDWLRKTSEVNTFGTDIISTILYLKWNDTESEPKRLIKQITTTTGQPTVTMYSDAFDRETRKAVVGFDGINVYVDKEYDNFGRLKSSSAPYKSTESQLLTTYGYDQYDRPVKVLQPNGGITTYSYSGNKVTEIKNGVTTSKTTDVTGKLVNTEDPGGTVSYTYHPDGQPESVNTAGVVTSFEYVDDYNRQTKLIDPSAGTVATIYDDANHKVTQTWNSGKNIATISNKFGQPTSRTIKDLINTDITTTYSYDPTYGRPTGSTSTNGTSKSIDYDTYGRLWKSTETVSAKTYQEVYGYNQGHINTITYNTGSGTSLNALTSVAYKYNNGYLYRLEDASGNRLREINAVNALGMETDVLLGNGLTTMTNYTPEGMWTNVKTYNKTGNNNVRQNMSFDFNRVTGTLNSRSDVVRGLSESFTYDNMYRLKTFGSGTMDYNSNGNISTKSDAGGLYNYTDATKPYTLSTVTNANTDLTNQLNVDYTVMSRPTSIRPSSTYPATTGLNAVFTYNDDYERAYMQLKQGTTETMSKYYFAGGKYEIETVGGIEKQRLYVDGSPYTASILLEKVGGVSPQTYYLHRDYLGSITQITDNSANLAAEYSYDAWGRMRNPVNWQVYAQGSQPAMLFGARGYTGHEQLNGFGLINMNARLYDPVLARFLAPDPYVGSGMSNDFNRYVYCRDNPMMYSDPTGEFKIPYFEIGWGFGLPGSNGGGGFYRGSFGPNSGFSGNYNPNTNTFTAGSTYYGYQTSQVMYNPNNQNYQMNSSSHVLVGHYYTTYNAVWMANANTIKVNSTGSRHDVYADYSSYLKYPTIQNNLSIDPLDPNQALSSLNTTLGAAGLYTSAKQYQYMIGKSWRGINGNWYTFTRGANQYTGARSTAVANYNKFDGYGKGLFYASTLISGYQGVVALKHGDMGAAGKSGLDIAMGVVGTYGGPWGAGASGLYYFIDNARPNPQSAILFDPNIAKPDNTNINY